MLGIQNLPLFIVSGLILNVTPGPDMLYVATRSAAQGRGAGVVSALAISTGGLVHTLAAAAGLSALIVYSPVAFQAIKWAGAAYLIYLGVGSFRRAEPAEGRTAGLRAPLGQVFRQGVLISVLNPKVILFFLAFLPHFADPDSGRFAVQIVCLGLIFNTGGTMVNTAVALLFGVAGEWFSRRGYHKFQSRLTGCIMIVLGVGLAAFAAQ